MEALIKNNNWNFNGDATGWSSTSNNGTDVCGSTTSSTADTGLTTFGYNGNLGGQTAYQLITNTGKNIKARGMIYQTVTAPGTGTVKAKGRFAYYGSSTAWNTTANSSWVRIDLYDSGNTNHVASLGCVSFNSNQAWTTNSISSDVDLTGGTTYTIRATLRGNNKNTNGSAAVTVGIDDIVVDFAPVGLSSSAPADTTNVSLSWTTSTGGTGAPGLHASTPYKVYRDTTSSVSTFLSNASTNSYTDTSSTGNSTYYYAVSDVDTNSLESPLSAVVSQLTRPSSPGTPTFTNVQATTLTVNWTAPTGGATSYKVERCTGTSCSDFSQIASGVTDLFFNDSNLSAETLYRYRIRATNATGDSSYSGIGEQTTGSSAVISVAITSDGSVSYGFISAGGSQNTTSGSLNDTQTAQNDGNVTETFNIKTTNATSGVQWTVGSSPGSDVYVHEFSTNGGGAWTKFTTADSYQQLATGITSSSTQNFDLKITVPSSSSDYQQKSITITIQAVQQ